jgi:hypothetical protein
MTTYVQGFYFDTVRWPETTGNSNYEKKLGMILRSWILSTEKKAKRPSCMASEAWIYNHHVYIIHEGPKVTC